MAGQGGREVAIKFTPRLQESDTLSGKIGVNRVSPYKSALFVHDVLTLSLALGVGLWTIGSSYSVRGGLSQSLILFIFSLMVIAFFPTYGLYNYHLIFSGKKHLASLAKSLCWSSLSISVVFFLYTWPGLLEENLFLSAIFLAALGLMLLSRFLWDQILNLIKAIGLSFLTVGMIALMNGDEKPITLTNWPAISVCFSLVVVMLMASRYFVVQVVFNNWLRRHFRRQVAIVGSDQEAESIANLIIAHNAPFWVSGVVCGHEAGRLEVSVPKDRLGKLEDLPLIVEQNKIDEIIVTDEKIDQRTLISLLDYCTSQGLTVWFSPKLLPIIEVKLYIDNFCGLPMIKLCSQKNSWLANKIKYGVDALITLPVFLLLFPIFLVIALAIKLSSPGPVFYPARAVGRDGKEFVMYKFRSMKVNDSSEIHKDFVTKLIKGEIRKEEQKGGVFKVTDDPRVTSFGNFLRKSSLDELPQLINVLKGDMSLVGPRPCLPYEYDIYKDWHKKRLSGRPGISGLWQVAGRSSVTFEDMVLLDLYYIYNRSLLMDMSVLYETVFALLGKKGAF